MTRILLLAALALSTTGNAHPTGTADNHPADPDTARWLSIVGSAVPVAATGLGLFLARDGASNSARDAGIVIGAVGTLAGIVTPAAGEFYSHKWLTAGMAMRAGAILPLYLGFITTSTEICATTDSQCRANGAAIIGLGAALYIGGVVLDIALAPRAAHSWNRRHELQVIPTAMRSNSSTTSGLALSMKF